MLVVILAIVLIAIVAVGIRYLLVESRAAPRSDSVQPLQPSYSAYQVARVGRAVGPEGIVALAIRRYQLRPGGLPNSLDDLVRRPPDLPPEKAWGPPYINTEALLVDPWGNRYRYRVPGQHSPDGYDLWSAGPDGKDGTGDDIGNWNLPETAAENRGAS
jgi:general secretion pathway protein G